MWVYPIARAKHIARRPKTKTRLHPFIEAVHGNEATPRGNETPERSLLRYRLAPCVELQRGSGKCSGPNCFSEAPPFQIKAEQQA